MAGLDWEPIRFVKRAFSRPVLAGLCRHAAVGLVTPMRDGMNLVAKEYVAVQDPANPGVLVLSRFAGAARQMREALIVNPFDKTEAAEAIATALVMPLEERQERHARLAADLEAHDVNWWAQTYLSALMSRQKKPPVVPPPLRVVRKKAPAPRPVYAPPRPFALVAAALR